jgi:hypothetical protein
MDKGEQSKLEIRYLSTPHCLRHLVPESLAVSGARLRLEAPCPTLIFLTDHRIASPIVYFLFLSFFFFLFCGFSFSFLIPCIMGNLCSRSANTTDPFSQPGRVLGSSAQASQDPNRASVPANVRTIQGPGRTLGGSKTDSSEGVGGVGDARSRAAEAAQVGLKAPLPSRANLVIAIIS